VSAWLITADEGRSGDMTTDQVPSAGRREWIGLAVLALPTLLLARDASPPG
jgi:hypothetical protein